MDLVMEAVGMTEGMTTEHIPLVMCTAVGVQHQLGKQHTPGLGLNVTMDALQHEQQGLMIGQQAACRLGSMPAYQKCDRAAQQILTPAAVHINVGP